MVVLGGRVVLCTVEAVSLVVCDDIVIMEVKAAVIVTEGDEEVSVVSGATDVPPEVTTVSVSVTNCVVEIGGVPVCVVLAIAVVGVARVVVGVYGVVTFVTVTCVVCVVLAGVNCVDVVSTVSAVVVLTVMVVEVSDGTVVVVTLSRDVPSVATVVNELETVDPEVEAIFPVVISSVMTEWVTFAVGKTVEGISVGDVWEGVMELESGGSVECVWNVETSGEAEGEDNMKVVLSVVLVVSEVAVSVLSEGGIGLENGVNNVVSDSVDEEAETVVMLMLLVVEER